MDTSCKSFKKRNRKKSTKGQGGQSGFKGSKKTGGVGVPIKDIPTLL